MEILRSKLRLTTLLVAMSLLSVAVLTAFSSVEKVHAATGSMYLSPSSQSILLDNQFTVQVRGNAPSANAAQIDISYPSASLDLLTYSSSGSVMTTLAQAPVTSAGSFSAVIFAGGGAAPLTSDSLLMSFTFKAKAGSGTGAITLLPSSKLVDAGTQVITTYGSTTVSFTSPPTPPVSAPVISQFTPSATTVVAGNTVSFKWAASNSVGCTITPNGPTNTTATSWTSPALNIVGISGSTFTLTCKNSNGVVSVPRTVSVTVSAIPVVTPKPPVTTDGAKTASASGTSTPTKSTPTPTKSGSGTVTSTPTPTAAATPKPAATPTPEVKGAYTPPVALTPTVDAKKVGLVETTTLVIKDKSGKPMANVEIIFDGTNSKVFKTDKDGRVVVTNVPAGKLSMTIKSNGKELGKQDVTLVAGVTDTAQQVSVESVSGSSNNTLIISGVAILAILLLAAAGIIIFIKKRSQPKTITLASPATGASATVVATPTISKDALDAASANSAKVIVGSQDGQVAQPKVVAPEEKPPK